MARLGAGPPLVLLHGYPDNLQIWCELAPRLADRFAVIAPDWPGMGYSEAWPGGATPFHMADRLLALLDAWGLDRVALAGLDMGGQPALAFAARHPERVSRLVVMNSLVQWDEATSWEIRILRRFGWNRLILRRLPRAVFRRAERTFLPRGVHLPPELRADLWSAFRRPEVRAFIAKMCAGYQGTLPQLRRAVWHDHRRRRWSSGPGATSTSRSPTPSGSTPRSPGHTSRSSPTPSTGCPGIAPMKSRTGSRPSWTRYDAARPLRVPRRSVRGAKSV